MFGLFGCNDKKNDAVKYKVDYNGQMGWYENAKEEYAAGDQVELYFSMIATDTDYHFYLDGADLDQSYDEEKGFILRFTMPDHDVKLTCESKNSMVWIPPTDPSEPGVKLISSYRGSVALPSGDHYDEIVAESYSADQVKLTVYHSEDGKEDFKTYLVPHSAVDECYEMIDFYGMRDWNSRTDTDSLEGARLECEFLDGGGYTTVTSDKMPENGKEAFGSIESILKSYVKDEYLI